MGYATAPPMPHKLNVELRQQMTTMINRIVLGYPYEGAFYWLMSAEEWRESLLKSPYRGNHPYYKTLYGSRAHEFVDKTCSLCILYDEILLAPADCYMHDYKKWTQDRCYQNKDMGVISDWDWIKDHTELSGVVRRILEDDAVNTILGSVPARAREQIIRGTLVQLSVADTHDAHLLGNRSYLRLCDHVRALLGAPQPTQTDDITRLVNGLRAVFRMAALRFSLGSVREFVSLRKNATLKQYAKSFRERLPACPDDHSAQLELYRSMAEAINTSEIADQINGGLNVSATITGVTSLVPIVGTAAGLLGLGVDASSKAAAKVKDQNSWWLLAPEIAKTLTRARIEYTVKALEKGDIGPTSQCT